MDPNNKKLNFLYNTVLGRVLLKLIFARRWFSKLASIYYNSPLSKVEGYKSYNEYFTRTKEINIKGNKGDLIATAESKLSVYKANGQAFKVKNSIYDLEELIQDAELAKEFEDGTILIFRLEYDDYHRYIFIDDGEILYNKKIKGELHTVRPISSKYKVFIRNSRDVTIMNTENFGKIIQVEVGALLVGKINNYNLNKFKRGQEKGFFEFGGSTIIQVYKKGIINIEENKEEKDVEIGEKIC